MQPKVSIIIPVYNAEKYLEECLECASCQTLKDIEIICIDDGSKDRSLEILKSFAQKDTRLKILSQVNKGAGAARNLGLANARGEYLSFFDSDDLYDKEMLEEFYNLAVSKNADVVVCNYNYFNNNTKEIIKNQEDVIPDFKEEVLNRKILGKDTLIFFKEFVCNKIFKRSFIDKNNIRFQEIKRANDLFFAKGSIALADRIACIDKEFMHYRVGLETNLSCTNSKTPTEFTKALIRLQEFLKEQNIYEELEASFKEYAAGLINYTFRTLKMYPKEYYELKRFIFNELVVKLDLSRKDIKAWGSAKIMLSYILSLRKIKFSSKRILTIFGKNFVIEGII